VDNAKTHFVTDSRYLLHDTGFGHPENPKRYIVIVEALKNLQLLGFENRPIKPRQAKDDEILLCHTSDYYKLVQNEVEKYPMLSTGDAVICPASFEVAILASGAVLEGVDAVMQAKAKNVFCLVRPPGHHACSNRGMGFCIFNNVAIGARYVQRKYGIERVLIVDWDVHHGNGTQEIFEEDPSVFYFSTHQEGIYPGTGFAKERGTGLGEGSKLNCPIIAGMSSRIEVIKAFQEKLVPAMEEFQPEFVFISAGFDAHELDPLGRFNLTDQDFAELTYIVKRIADRYSEGRIVSVLEGGYNLKALASAAVAHVTALAQ